MPDEVVNIVPIPPYEGEFPGEITPISVPTPGDDTGESYLRQLLADFAAVHVAKARGLQNPIYLPSLGGYYRPRDTGMLNELIHETAMKLGVIPVDAVWGLRADKAVPLGEVWVAYSPVVGYVGNDSGVTGAGAYIARWEQNRWWVWDLKETVFY